MRRQRMNRKRVFTIAALVLILTAILTVPAAAVDKGDVQSAISASSKEEVAGNIFIWFLCAIGFLKVSQKIDSFMASLGINVGRTGGSMMAELLLAGRAIRGATNIFGGSSNSRTSVRNGSDANSAGRAASSSPAGGHGLIGMANRVVGRAAAAGATGIGRGIGGRVGETLFDSSLAKGGTLAAGVISSVALGSISQNGTITGTRAAEALTSYLGFNQGSGTAASTDASAPIGSDASAVIPKYRNVEIGGGRITGYETTPGSSGERQFAMYSMDQYMEPSGNHEVVKTADGASWYKQYAEPVVKKTPRKESGGRITYEERIVEQMPQIPKRKDRV